MPSDGPGVDRLDRLGKQLGQHAGRVDEQGQYPGERAETDRHHEQHGKDHLVDGPQRIHQPPDRLADPDRRDVLGPAARPKGIAATTASTVPQIAIWIVISIS